MNKRIQQFLAAENITQSQFADSINVARASVSHIIAGRNKPGFDFIENMARRYPSLNLEWLITGKGRMYKTDDEDYSLFSEPAAQTPPAVPPARSVQDVPAAENAAESILEDLPEEFDDTVPSASPSPSPSQSPSQSPAAEPAVVVRQAAAGAGNPIKKMIVLFSDGTYQELVGKE